uniref:Uncharacterized protein n=1 Tax=Burkholderia phage vB_BgluM-SURPRISE13 TaxID=3159457 RepID=A0AAU7PFE3_9VIRU
MNNENIIKMNNVILRALFNKGQETTCTLAAIKLHIKKAGIEATQDEVLIQLYAMENNGELQKTKNSNDWDAWGLSLVTRTNMFRVMEQNPLVFDDERLEAIEKMNSNDARLEATRTLTQERINAAYGISPAGEMKMNKKNVLTINVKTNSDEAVEAKMTSNYEEGRTKIVGLNNLFAVGLIHAHYEFEASDVQDEDIGNGTGYYDPLTSAVFIDEQGVAVSGTKTVRFLDEKSYRRLYIIVVHPGMNVIIHDRFSFTEKGFAGTLVCTTGVNCARQAIGMEPAWAEGCLYDFVMACRMFGFEYDRRSNEVYMPRRRVENAFEIGLQGAQEITNRIRKMQGAQAE